jgi:hypothetical protein
LASCLLSGPKTSEKLPAMGERWLHPKSFAR